ncbi:MAG: hypothetical protein M1821_003808 [Bathelium mastoideum]|nr:MAG: hypothetical protein M1821_003808 [Bathelium mastoideum]
MDLARNWHTAAGALREQRFLADSAGNREMGRVTDRQLIVHPLEYQGVREMRNDRYLDMAIKYDDSTPKPDGDFASIRDSLYILMTMNQFKMKPDASLRKETEGLLRIVLFSKDLELLKTDETLKEVRQKYAAELRAGRKRGVVPVFVSTLWFLLALAISIQASFSNMATPTTAHDLALGLLLAWLPVLILCSIVDRNPTTSENIRKKLNKIVDKVRLALLDPEHRDKYIASFSDRGEKKYEEIRRWIMAISIQAQHLDEFFTDFAGQGRVRYHYGAAHPILSDIERCYIGERGRDWLRNEDEARCELVLGQTNQGLIWFDPRDFWQILVAFLIVFCTVLGAFVLSFFTPTVGLGCRSGGYLVFIVFATTLVFLEMLVWWSTSPGGVRQDEQTGLPNSHFQRSWARNLWNKWSFPLVLRARPVSQYLCAGVEKYVVKGLLTVHYQTKARAIVQDLQSLNTRQWMDYCFFRPLEIINFLWILYIAFGQTIGAFRSCTCMTNSWGSRHGYMDFTTWNATNSAWVWWYWTTGTVIATTTLCLAMAFVVVEWCTQSHLSSQNYENAYKGLVRTRRFKRMIGVIYTALCFPAYPFARIGSYFRGPASSDATGQRSLKWTMAVTYRPPQTHFGSSDSDTERLLPASPLTSLKRMRSSDASPV